MTARNPSSGIGTQGHQGCHLFFTCSFLLFFGYHWASFNRQRQTPHSWEDSKAQGLNSQPQASSDTHSLPCTRSSRVGCDWPHRCHILMVVIGQGLITSGELRIAVRVSQGRSCGYVLSQGNNWSSPLYSQTAWFSRVLKGFRFIKSTHLSCQYVSPGVADLAWFPCCHKWESWRSFLCPLELKWLCLWV